MPFLFQMHGDSLPIPGVKKLSGLIDGLRDYMCHVSD